MQLGVIGLGRMGGNIVRRLQRGGHMCVVFDVNPDSAAHLVQDGAVGARSLDELVEQLAQPRAIWLMVPAGEPTEQLVRTLAERLAPDDVILDGGNSYFKDDTRRATLAQAVVSGDSSVDSA
jgi:6-phosphogluconate dehydrogenase